MTGVASLVRRLAEAGASSEVIAIAVEAVETSRDYAKNHRAALRGSKGFDDQEPCFLYVMQTSDGLSKIGISNNPRYRAASLKYEHQKEHTIYELWEFSNKRKAYELEQKAHSQLDSFRVNGEYFQAHPHECSSAINSILIEASLEAEGRE